MPGILNVRNGVIAGAVVLIAVLGAFLAEHIVVFLVAMLVVVIAVACVLWLLIQRERKAKQAGRELESVLDRQVEAEIQRSTFGQQVEVRNLKAEWDKAIAEFKRSPAGRRLGDKALAQLPMYLVIGPPGSGKTTFIGESGLQSVLRDATRRPRAVRGVGGGRSFDWWFTEQAILLDMAGKALKMSQFDDSDDWVSFLQSLRKLRPERPINGVLFTVPITQVAGADKAEVQALATALRERGKDLGHHLGMEFPVYVVITHADAITGFAETFAAFTPEQAAQPWGMTLTREQTRVATPDAVFDAEWTTLVNALGSLRTERLGRLPDATQRMRALALPAQLERLRGDLRQFVQLLFGKAGAKGDGGFLRGFYLTSSQVGEPALDRVLADAAAGVGVVPRTEAPTMEIARHSWFSQHVWRAIVFKDALLASATDYAVRAEQRQRLVLLGASGLALLLFATLFGVFAWDAGKPVRQVADAAEALAGLRADTVPRDAWPRLDNLRIPLEELDRRSRHGSFALGLGAYAGGRVLGPANQFYIDKAQQFLVAPVADAIEDSLVAMTQSPSAPFADLFHLYQVYRLIRDPEAKVVRQDSVAIGKVLVLMHRGGLQHLEPNDVSEARRIIYHQAQRLAELGEPHHTGTFHPEVARAALDRLRARWSEWPTLYQDMVADANDVVPPLALADLFPRKHPPVLLASDATVQGAYTRAGWEGMVRPRLAVLGQMVAREHDPQLAQLGVQVDSLTRRRAADYARDYVGRWVAFLGSLRAQRDPNGDGRYVAAMRREGGGKSEIEAALHAVDEQTSLEGPPADVEAVRRHFTVLHRWITRPRVGFLARVHDAIPFIASDGHPSPQQEFRSMLRKGAKKGVTGEGYTAAANQAFNFTRSGSTPVAAADFDDAVGRALYHLLTVMYDPLHAGGSAGAVGGGSAAPGQPPGSWDAMAFANDWRTMVVEPFSSIAGRYPLEAGGADMKVDEFATFFKPGGPFDGMYEKYFKGFLSRKGALLAAAPAGMGPEQIGWMKRALEIQDAMFGDGGAQPRVAFDVRTRADRLSARGALFSVMWQVGDQEFTYEMGEEEPTTLAWSPESSSKGSSVRAVLGGQAVQGPKGDGEWGFFHVLDEATFKPGPNGDVIATWTYGGVRMAVQITPKHVPHPFSRHFLELKSPPAVN